MRICELEHKKVAIWGAGREGISTLNVLRKKLPALKITIVDDQRLPEKTLSQFESDPLVSVLMGKDAIAALPSFEVVIKSPGISLYRPEVQNLKRRGIFVTSATRLWFAERPKSQIVCITGTKGKSTTASLLAHIVESCGLCVTLAGNIGVPLFAFETKPAVWVIEMSSYQAADLDASPDIAVLLNLFPEHLDWHLGVNNYYADKLNLLYRAKTAVVNAIDRNIAVLCQRSDLLYFNDESGLHIKNGQICHGKTNLLPVERVQLVGKHNLSNVCAALATALCMGLDIADCARAVPSFFGLCHRLSPLGKRNGILYVDDSISTTPQSTIAAIESFPGCRISLLLGGFDRSLDYEELVRFLTEKPFHAIITMPESGEKIATLLEQSNVSLSLYRAKNIEQAVEIAAKVTPEGGVVLLSPAAPSYGQFKNFEHRGRAFAQAAGFGTNTNVESPLNG